MKKYTQEEAILLTDNAIKQINIDFPTDSANIDSYTVKSIKEQLQYVKDALENKNSRDRLKYLTIGLLAVRELEPGYESLTDKIYTVCEIVRQMQKHKSNGETWL